MKPEDIVKQQQVERFFAEAFLIDGVAKVVLFDDSFKVGAVVQLTDSKRGTFYIAQLTKK